MKKPPIFGDDATVPTTGHTAGEPASGTRLLILGGDEPVSFPLTEAGTYTIGRSLEADIYVKDPSLSRIHAALTYRAAGRERVLTIRDLGSSNGTRLKGRAIPAETEQPFQLGDPIELGRCTLVVQQGSGLERPRRVWPHSYLELKVEEHCGRAQRNPEPFSILRVRIESAVPEQRAEATLTSLLGQDDFVAGYAPLIYDVLLARGGPQEADEAASAVRFGLRKLGAECEISIVCFPREGRAPAELIARLSRDPARPARAAASRERSDIVIEDPAMQQLYALVDRVAESEISVLILGETGVGKEIMAQAIHRRSRRSEKPFVALNCGAFTAELLESELFGHERGAFTGAVKHKPGLLETVEGGTLFLDEVGEMALETQVKLLRVIEERQLRRVGGLEPVSFDARFIAATNRDLEAQVRQGSFREDLFYRLNGFSLIIPPLRERPREIVSLSKAFAKNALRRQGHPAEPVFTPAALSALAHYGWPGNVRELRNVIERAVLLSAGPRIDLQHLPMEKLTSRVIFGGQSFRPEEEPPTARHQVPPRDEVAGPNVLRSKMATVERDAILAALEQCGGNQTRAAEMLGMSRKSLVRRLDSYDLPRPRKGRGEE